MPLLCIITFCLVWSLVWLFHENYYQKFQLKIIWSGVRDDHVHCAAPDQYYMHVYYFNIKELLLQLQHHLMAYFLWLTLMISESRITLVCNIIFISLFEQFSQYPTQRFVLFWLIIWFLDTRIKAFSNLNSEMWVRRALCRVFEYTIKNIDLIGICLNGH